MRILVISDTHGELDRFWKVFNKLNKDSSLDINTFNTLSNNESMKLRKTANN